MKLRFHIKLTLRRLLPLVMLLALLPLFAGCGGPKPTEPVDSFFTSLARCDFATAQKYLAEPVNRDSFQIDLLPLLQGLKQNSDKIAMYDNLAILMAATKWQVKDMQIDGEAATVSLTLTTYDFSRLYQKILDESGMQSIQQLSEDGGGTLLPNIVDVLRDSLAKEAKQKPLSTITRDLDIQLEQSGQKWKISGGAAFFDDISNGLYTQIQQ